ncbi:MAG: response regulator [Gemmatimonadales bacterium]|nr:MAG: response regulator [Gemmatimonadales bacterium]
MPAGVHAAHPVMRPRRTKARAALLLVCLPLLASSPAPADAGSVAGNRGVTAGAPDPLPGLDPSRTLDQYGIDAWGEREGLPQNFVNSLAQTPDGYLWMGTERGLVRFDGIRFTVFTAEDTEGLSSSWVRSLTTGPAGELWIGTGGGGLVRLRNGTFTTWGPEEGLPGRAVTQLATDPDGRVWAGLEGGGLARLGPDGAIRSWGPGDGLSGESVTALAVDSTGGVWVGTPGGLDRVAGDELRAFGPEDGLSGRRVEGLDVSAGGELRVATAAGDLHGFDGQRFVDLDPEGELTGALVSTIRHDRQGALWIATNGNGLYRLTDDGIDHLDSGGGLPSNLLWSVLEDREGHLWIGSNAAGLIRLRDGPFDIVGAPEGLSMDVALALMEGRDGTFWIGTPGGGLNRIRDGEVTAFTTARGLGNDIVLSLAEDPEGSLWVGMAAGGVSRVRGEEVETFTEEDGIGGAQVTVTFVDSEGALWLGVTGLGVRRWRGAPPRTVGTAEGLPPGSITTMLEDARGRIWVGTREGLGRIDGERVEAFGPEDGLPAGGINSLWEAPDGTLWVATMGGLARMGPDGRIQTAGPDVGLPAPEPMAVLGDGEGNLWITSSQGVSRVSLAELEAALAGEPVQVVPEQFGRADGLRSQEANGGIHPAIWQASDGAIWFPTMQGAVRIDPDSAERRTLPPRPTLEDLVVGTARMHPAGTVRLPPGERVLEVRFSAPTFQAPREMAFRYQLQGFDPDWVRPGDRRTAFYTNLPPGDYTFRVQAAGRDGIWNTADEARLELELAPHVWERDSVRAAGALAFLLLLGAGYRYRIRTMEEREARLLALVEARERTQAALRQSEERLRLALEAGRMGTWEWRPGEDTHIWSEGMEHLFGPPPRGDTGLVDRLVEAADPEDRDRVRRRLEQIRNRSTEAVHFDFRLAPPEELETPRQVEFRGRWTTDDDGADPRIIGVAGDVTALIEAQRALRAREEELRQSQKMEAVGRLAGGIAHDFNNLLAVIGGNGRLALDTLPADHPVAEDIREVVRAGDRAADLTQQLLAFGRKQVLQPRILDLNEVVGEMERMLRRLLRANVTLETDLAGEPTRIVADAGSLEQILLNLALNAQDAMEDGGHLTISTRSMPGEAATDDPVAAEPHVRLEVRDTGHGMDEETRQRIFEPFFTTKELGKGTGLGLATVYGIVQQSGASIETLSRVGRGTTFVLRFPIAPPEPAAEDTDRRAEPRMADRVLDGRVLLVEDSRAVRSVTRRILERAGLQVVESSTAEDALEAMGVMEALGVMGAEEEALIQDPPAPPFDLVLTDVSMPGLSGMDLARELRRRWPSLPVVVMSGQAAPAREVAPLLEDGSGVPVRFISKPFSPPALTALVAELLEDGDA